MYKTAAQNHNKWGWGEYLCLGSQSSSRNIGLCCWYFVMILEEDIFWKTWRNVCGIKNNLYLCKNLYAEDVMNTHRESVIMERMMTGKKGDIYGKGVYHALCTLTVRNPEKISITIKRHGNDRCPWVWFSLQCLIVLRHTSGMLFFDNILVCLY